MKVSELIEVLKQCPQGGEVYITYDMFVCTCCPQVAIVVEEKAHGWLAGTYLCTESPEDVEWISGRVPNVEQPQPHSLCPGTVVWKCQDDED